MSRALVIGLPGTLLSSVIAALTEFGINNFQVVDTDTTRMSKQQLVDLTKPFDSVLFVSQDGNIDQTSALHAVCQTNGQLFIPIVRIGNCGLVGPFIDSKETGCWDSVWRTIHLPTNSKESPGTFSDASWSLLANVMVTEWLNLLSNKTTQPPESQIYLLHMDTLQGSWYPVVGNPVVTNTYTAQWLNERDFDTSTERISINQEQWFSYFETLSSRVSGIFYRWDEEDLTQLPLALCRVQVTDPLSKGPARRLPERVCSGFTHETARREAGLCGVEDYVEPMIPLLLKKLSTVQSECMDTSCEFVGVGAGFTRAEAICRGLQKALDRALEQGSSKGSPIVKKLDISEMDDRCCRYYLQALSLTQGKQLIAMGQDQIFGFPVVWTGADDHWFGGVGLNWTFAMRNALKKALEQLQNRYHSMPHPKGLETSLLWMEDGNKPTLRILSESQVAQHSRHLDIARRVLKNNGRSIHAFEITLEPFLRKDVLKVFGVILREEKTKWDPK